MAMFEGFSEKKLVVSETEINLVTAGSGPPLLLLHGYPQSHVMWHKVAVKLAESFTLVIPDLRGYGDSGIPKSDEKHYNYSKRATAKDQVEVMEALGHKQFMVCGHDRGGRVAHRMTLDYPDKVLKLCVLDIVPTYRVFEDADKELATKYWHWFFLIQRSPVPETLISNSVEFYLRTQFGAWAHGENTITDGAFAEYLRCFKNEDVVHATCEDYRAGASIDLEHDREDLNAKITCPVLALWGAHGAMHKRYDVVRTWKERASRVEGWAIESGHFIPEEAPEEIVYSLSKFFANGK
jgi:haloacetate dehalogenase